MFPRAPQQPLQLGKIICGVCSLAISAACTRAVDPAPAAHLAATTRVEATNVGQQLDSYMQEQVKRNHFTGTVLVIQAGDVLLARGYGYADTGRQTPNTLQTKFRLGSLTKQFTATAIMQLRERNLLRLQDSLCKYLQPCAEAWKPVTLHHLLSHTSGIAGYGEMPDPKTSTIPPWTAEQIAAQFRAKPLEFPPGTRWHYSDWGYCLSWVWSSKA